VERNAFPKPLSHVSARNAYSTHCKQWNRLERSRTETGVSHRSGYSCIMYDLPVYSRGERKKEGEKGELTLVDSNMNFPFIL